MDSIHYYNILKNKGYTEQEALEILSQLSRDNCRSPMQWDSGKYAGFSEQEPWISAPENHTFINVEAEEQDKDSILNFYRKLVSLRKRYEVIQEGTVQFIDQKQPELLVYMRTMKGQKLLVASNFSGHEIVPEEPLSFAGGECLICNYPQRDREDRIEVLRPYESIVLFCAEST